MSDLKKATAWYKGAALLLLNGIVFFVILNLLLAVAMGAWHGVANDKDPVSRGYSADDLRKVYPALSDDQRSQLLSETWTRPLIYEQFVEFKERPFRGKYVNVGENGFRLTSSPAPWPVDPKNFNVFVLGGSTTFGYGVADDQTIPACLEQLLGNASDGRPVRIYNFGCGYYYSTQERILFERLLQTGHKPDLAIFIDGLNDFFSADEILPYTNALKKTMDGADLEGNISSREGRLGKDSMEMFRLLPIGRALGFLSRKFAPNPPVLQASPEVLSQVVQRYAWSKKAIEAVAQASGARAVFIFQPVPMYKYDLKFHLFGSGELYQHKNSFAGYPMMAQYVANNPMGDDFLWLADIQQDVQKPLYCDAVHYTAEFNREIAGRISEWIKSRNLR